ncbi:excalibur calcium-binding domain-containing protein [Roseivivax marinus]|uniref:excalibur calcium-binding domain-containing protein n=1 Tax=Roseivivax marinus TaxID=1379903 RepID=UPI003514C36E
MRMHFITCVFLAASACATVENPTVDRSSAVQRFEQTPTSMLWAEQQSTTSALDLALIEAELATRGQTQSGSAYLGKRSSSSVGQMRYSRNTVSSGSDRNCSDFSSPGAAQKFFLAAGGPASDPNGLDRDGDGFACEWGTSLRATARRARPAPAPVRVTSSRCYTGPRGGTYTLTASGNKNYDGC